MRTARACFVCVCLVSCMTHAGAFHDRYVQDLECRPCENTYFCSEGARILCPANSLSEFSANNAAPSDVEDCVCVPGFNRTGNECELAPTGAYYYVDGAAEPCPQHKRTYVPGASKPADCVCIPGYFTDEVGGCVQCAPDSFNDKQNVTACTDCPLHSSHALHGSSKETDCVCDAGAYSVSDEAVPVACELCAGGYFKSTAGSRACEGCLENQFSNGTGASTCHLCHDNSVSASLSSSQHDCVCVPGFATVAEDVCVGCGIGKFKATTSHAQCDFCADGEFQDASAQSHCGDCLSHSQSDSQYGFCLCEVGYTSSPPGSQVSRPSCLECPSNTFKDLPGQQSCLPCLLYFESEAASTHQSDCLCSVGYGFTGLYDACVPCQAGTYKPTVGNAEHGDDCTACPAHTFSGENSSLLGDCICNAGFRRDSLELGCVACDLGEFKPEAGEAACGICPANTYNPYSHATQCQQCYNFSTSPAGSSAIADCVCDSGYVLEADECVPCLPGSYADAQIQQCIECIAGSYTAVPAQDVCVACPVNSHTHSHPYVGCDCNTGYKCRDEFGTSICLYGECEACSAGTYNALNASSSACSDCQANSISTAAATHEADCQCIHGYRQDGASVCVSCNAGTYSDTLDALSCSPCDGLLFSNEEAQVTCKTCASNSVSDADGTGCVCEPGYANVSIDASGATGCRECEAGKYKDVVGNSECLACRQNSESDTATVTRNGCACVEGYFLLDDECTACGLGSYKPHVSNDACRSCPPSYTTAAQQSVSSASCVCAPTLFKDTETTSTCENCPQNTVKPEYSNSTCTACRPNSTRPINATADTQLRCLCDPGFELQTSTLGNVPMCVMCAQGKSRDLLANALCVTCLEDTFAAQAASAACVPCGKDSSTHDSTGQSLCDCVVGFARLGGETSECETCESGKFKDNHHDTHCHSCSLCDRNDRVVYECNATHDVACSPCQDHSSTLGRQRSRVGLCDCDVGYELLAGVCVPCGVGTYKDHTNNSFACVACLANTFSSGHATVTCGPCTPSCQDTTVEGEPLRFFVETECTPATDIVCEACTVCLPGTYDLPTCGLAVQNDRQDTVCAACEPTYWCAGGGHREVCASNAVSPPGSTLAGDCGCDDGYHLVHRTCEPCEFDHYCFEGRTFACPNASVTMQAKSDSIMDCICLHGYFRSLEMAVDQWSEAEGFVCDVCTPDDYCFNNSRYNCSDERMRAEVRSDSRDDCRCVEGYYNNHNNTRCLPCEVDHYCTEGVQTPCESDEWTAGQTRQAVCMCRPGLYVLGDACVECGPNQYCVGDDFAEGCRANSRTRIANASVFSDCLCLSGFEDHHKICRSCEAGHTFQPLIGNHSCGACTECKAADGVYTSVLCRTDQDATCDSCNPCSNHEQYTFSACQDYNDAECKSCTACDFAVEFESKSCHANQNRECTPISVDTTTCAAGYYRGGHTAHTDSVCLRCQYNDTQLNNQTLHQDGTHGQVYNDPYSCGVHCLGNSRKQDPARQYLGCVSCEVGNVLLKVFPTDMREATTCDYTCKTGYTRQTLPGGDDCYTPRMLSSVSNEFKHDLFIGDYTRVAGVSQFSVTHTSTGYYVVVVGPEAVSGCLQHACCYSEQWRVSTLAQMGLLTDGTDTCSGRSDLYHTRRSATSLVWRVSDSELETVANCSTEDEAHVCSLTVSLVDVTTMNVVSKTVVLRTTRSTTAAYMTGEKRMLPLTRFEVDISLLRVMPSGEHIFQLHTVASGFALQMHTRVVGMTQLSGVDGCERLTLTNSTVFMHSDETAVRPEANVSSVSYWQAGVHVDAVQAIFQLSMLGNPSDTMDVAAVREVRHLLPVCTDPVHTLHFHTGRVWSVAGLGAHTVHRMRQSAASNRTHGKLGSLLTFMAESDITGEVTITLDRILAAHVNAPAHAHRLVNATTQHYGRMDFTPVFREWCLANPDVCLYEYFNVYVSHANVFALATCSQQEQRMALEWLQSNFGVVHDARHVEALCTLKDDLRPYQSLAVLVNTMKYVNRQNHMWNLFQNFSATSIQSTVWADFRVTDGIE